MQQGDCNPMEVLLTRRCAKYIYVVPEGLRELMSDISREVLRCNPKEIYCFIADYLDALFITRENARVAALLVEDVVEAGANIREILFNTSLSLTEATRAARIIQRAFRRHLGRNSRRSGLIVPIDPFTVICKMMLRLNLSYEKASQCARIIQTAWRCYRQRMDTWRKRFETAVDWREAARYTLRMYRTFAATAEYTRAATLIQASYRGYYTRRYLKILAKTKICADDDIMSYLLEQTQYELPEEEEQTPIPSPSTTEETVLKIYNSDDSIRNKAARVIQKAFRRYMEIKKTHTVCETDANIIQDLQNVYNAVFNEEEESEPDMEMEEEELPDI